MDKRILSAGLVILIVGIFLIVAFWPIFATNGKDLAEDQTDGQFESYDAGDTVMFTGTITDIGETNLPQWMRDLGLENMVHIEIDGELSIVLVGTSSIDHSIGDDVYGKIVLQEQDILGMGTREYWELESKDNLNSKQIINYVFYGITGVGVATTVAGAVKI